MSDADKDALFAMATANLTQRKLLTKHAPHLLYGTACDHALKIHPAAFAEVLNGNKTHEVRVFDRDYAVDNVLKLQAYDMELQKYCGPVCYVVVTHITPPGAWGLPANIGVMSIALLGAQRD